MRRRDVLGLIAGAALPWPYPTRASQALLDDAVGFTGQILFLSVKTPALMLGVVRNGQTSIQGFGRRAADASEPPAADTLFRIGSITKAFTGQLLASLVADGVVSLADPLTKYVPEFIAPMSEGGRPIRLIDLATHSAGLPREVPHAPGPPEDPFVNVTHDAFVAWLKANPLMFTPGTSISYSNFGFDLLAAALAAAAHQPYPDLLDARVIRPLGLPDTTFAPSASQAARIMPGHDFDGLLLPNAATGSVIVGSGGLYSSPRDLLAWLEWHLDRFSNERAAERLSTTPLICGATGSTPFSGWTNPGIWTPWGSVGSSWRPSAIGRSFCRRRAGFRACFPMSPSRRRAGSASQPPSTRSTSPPVWRWPRPPTISSSSFRRARWFGLLLRQNL